jgi:hypothetical protein
MEMESCLRNLPRSDEPVKLLEPVERLVKGFQPDTVTQKELHGFIDELQILLGHVHLGVSACYFEAPASGEPGSISRPQAA